MIRTAFAIAMKDLRLLVRDRVGFFFIFLFPPLFGILFGYIFQGSSSGPSDVAIAVYDGDRSEISERFVQRLDETEQIRVVMHESEESALASVRGGDAPAALMIEDGFGERVDDPFSDERPSFRCAIDPSRAFVRGLVEGRVQQLAFQTLFDTFADAEQLDRLIRQARVQIRQDPDLSAGERLLFESFFTASSNLVGDMGAPILTEESDDTGEGEQSNVAGAFAPVKLTFVPLSQEGPTLDSTFQITMPQAFVWALMGCVAGFGMSIVTERSRGTLTRLAVAPISRWSILLGKALACGLCAIGVQVFLLLIFAVFFGVTPHSWVNITMAVLASTLAFVGLAMLLAVLARSESASEGASRAVLLVLALLGGGGVPLVFMPGWMQTLASVSPFKWSILAVEGAVWRDYSLMSMALPAGILTGIGLLGLLTAALVFARDPRLT